MAKIVLDPGHGGTTKVGGSSPNNAVGPTGLLEKTVTLDLGLRAEAALKAKGHTVALTRRTDVNVGLAARAKVAKDMKADVFVSIHLNGFNKVAQGTETLCDTNHSPASAALCLTVQKALLEATGLKDRNNGKVKAQSLGVLKSGSHASNTACCLVEISFMDVAAEEARLKTTAYRQAVAEALARGVVSHLAAGGLETMAPAAPRAAEDGYALLHRGGGGLESTARAARPARRKASKDDVNEFAIVDIGEGFDPKAKPKAADALETTGFDMAGFNAYVATLGLRHIGAQELLFLGASNGAGPCAGTNRLPPETLWRNIGATAQMLDEIRERLGAPCRVLSAYRAPAYNDCIGGESASLHMRFNAIDFRCASGVSSDWHAVARAVRSSNAKFKGGIGKYASFIHIDTRGTNANW
jgi:N-acetylmuramoyl-L-alanine amidase